MAVELLGDLAALALLIFCGYSAIRIYVALRHPHYSDYLAKDRLKVLGLLMLAIVGVKVAEDVFSHESKGIDEMLLRFIHEHVPALWVDVFRTLTDSGSVIFLVPVAVVAAVALFAFKRRTEAAMVVASLATAALLVYVIKNAVGRVRPALWDTEWFWGSSFPSGHTTDTAALSTALALCVARIWPRYTRHAITVAMLWTGLVGLSRMVLGVHWPTDVLAAVCLGVLVPLIISIAFDLYTHRQAT